VTALRALPLASRARAWARTLAVLPTLAGIARVNARIQRYQQDGTYRFYAEEEISRLLSACGFQVDDVRPAYAAQCWLLRAHRAGEGGP
jgi:hypothetical protein